MEINIVINNFDVLHKEWALKWRLFSRKRLFRNLLLIFLGALLIGLRDNINGFWGWDTSIGISFLLLAIFNLFSLVKSWYKFKNRIKTHSKDLKENGKPIQIKITDESVTYIDFQCLYEWKWSCFTSYKLYFDYLILVMDNDYDGFFINRNDISNQEFSHLLSFISKRDPAFENETETKILK